MPWATLRGFTLPVKRGSWRRRDLPLGEETVSIMGSTLTTRHAEREAFSGETTMLTAVERDAYRGLIKGLGEIWLWSSTFGRYSSKGTAASSTPTATTGGVFDGTGYRTVASGAWLDLSRSMTRRWWVEVWRDESLAVDGGGVSPMGPDGWHHYVISGSGDTDGNPDPADVRQWRDGVEGNHNVGHWFRVLLGVVGLKGASSVGVNADKSYSQVIVQPYWGLDAWPAVAAARTIAEAPLERLWLDGDDLVEARQVTGAAPDVSTVDGSKDGEANARRISFELTDAVNVA